METTAKKFTIIGIDLNNKRVKRNVVAMTKRLAVEAAKRSQIVKTIFTIKEVKG